MNLAIFDLDNTLLRGDSDYAWGQFLGERGLVDPHAYEKDNQRYYAQYRDGDLDIMEFLAFALGPLARLDRSLLDDLRERFVAERILPMIGPPARALVEKHRARGDELVIVTATNRFITEPIAREFDIAHLIATEPEERDGRFTGRVQGTPCYREGKIERLEAWAQGRDVDVSSAWFYSDSHNDLPLLSRVAHPVAVNPDPQLLAHARHRGWPILDLQSP
ncbi:MAG: histidinol-phosphatase [Acidiferrobacteraceae bacterium]